MADEVLLYLVRHAVAADRGPEFPDDAKRPLTEEGIARFEEVAAGLVAMGVEIEAVFTSPFVRARQTADLLAGAYKRPPRVTPLDALAVGRRPADIVESLGKVAKRRAVALVGHEPLLGELTAQLLGAKRPIPFKKGGVACISVASLPPLSGGTLVWFLTPRLLRRLAKGR